MSTTHAKTVVTADDGVSEVGSDEWNAGHNTSLSGGEVMLQQERFNIASTQRLAIADVARIRLLEATDGIRGSYSAGSQEVLNDNWMLQVIRGHCRSGRSACTAGTAELYVFDLAPVVRTPRLAQPAAATLTLAGSVPSVSLAGSATALPSPGALVLTGSAPDMGGAAAGHRVGPTLFMRSTPAPMPVPEPVYVTPAPAALRLLTSTPPVTVNDDDLVLALAA
jgi:hypothetical protein